MRIPRPLKTLSFLFAFFLSAGLVIGQNVPIDFEPTGNGSNWTWAVFENNTNPPLEIIQNPDQSGINGSATVAKFTALQAGNPWAGCESLHGSDIGTFTIDSTNSTITIMVWKSVVSDVGIKLVRVDNWSLGEIKVPNTKVNEWELITFDFSSHMGLTYDQIVIFPDFNARSSDNIIYFDNVFGPTSVPTGIAAPEKYGFEMYPNPALTSCNIRSDFPIEEIKVFNLVGELVWSEQMPGNTSTLDLAGFSKGIFLVRAKIEGEYFMDKLVKH